MSTGETASAGFERPGEVPRLLRAVDWARTPLGRPERWPAGLRAAFMLVLDAPCAGWLAWGKDFTFLCNDACLPLLGSRARSALGSDARHVWGAVRPEIRVQLERILKRGTPAAVDVRMLVDQDGSQTERRLSFALSPLHDESQARAGCLCLVSDQTEAHRAQRRWSVLRELNAQLAAAPDRAAALRALRRCLTNTHPEIAFWLLFLSGPGSALKLACASGLSRGAVAARPEAWPLERVLGEERALDLHDLASRSAEFPRGRWGTPAGKAHLVRICAPGGSEPLGVLATGLDARQPLDGAAREFVSDVAGLIGAHFGARFAPARGGDADARSELSRMRTLLAAIVESSGEAIYSKSLRGRIMSWNAGAQRIFGYAPHEIIGQPITLLVPPDRRDEERQILQRVRRGEPIHHLETRRCTRDGRQIEVMMSCSPVRNAAGRIVGASSVVHDITERKRAQQALFDSQARLQLATETGKIGVWDWEAATDTVTSNEALPRMLGCRPDEWPAAPALLAAHIHPDDRPRVEEAARSLLERDEPRELEFRLLRPDQRQVWVFASAAVLREGGRLVRVQGAMLDVTQRREAELLVRESEARFARFMHLLPGLAWIKDSRGRYIFVNDAAARAFGRERSELYGRTDEEVFPPETAAQFRAHDREAIRSETGVETIEVLDQADGRHYSIVRKFPIPDAEGGPALVGGIAIDITERIRTEQELKEAKEAAETANLAKDRFLAVLSHELRTPLTPVLMTIGALERDPSLSAALRETIAMMRRNIELEVRLINDLLDLSRVTSGKLRLRLEAVDLNGLVRHVCDMCRAEAEEKRIRLTCDLGEFDSRVRGDSARLQQVVWNLLRNALKFTPDDGLVEVSTRRTGTGRLCITVRDTGIGLKLDALERIFGPFEQADSAIARRFGGLGLGLSIAKALTELHGGTIRAESDGPGMGAAFVVELPEAPAPVQPPLTLASAPALAPAARLRVLVVEDHADTAAVLAQMLAAVGHQPSVAGSMSAALAAARDQVFDLVISDLGLRDGTGYEFMSRLLAIQDIPGIAVSGYGMEQDIRRSRAAGFAEHLVKPITLTQLEEAVARVAGGESQPPSRP